MVLAARLATWIGETKACICVVVAVLQSNRCARTACKMEAPLILTQNGTGSWMSTATHAEDYIGHQLTHAVRDRNGRAYNHTAHGVELRKVMQQ